MEKIKIPTILGLAILTIGIISGVFLVSSDQPFLFTTKAKEDQTPKNITLSNLEEDAVTISWQTASPVLGFVSFSPENGGGSSSVLDDRDTATPKERSTHHVTLKKLKQQTSYKYKIFSGKITTNEARFTTAPSSDIQNGFNPIIGSVIDSSGQPIQDGLVFLNIPGATIQSSVIKNLGNFIITLAQLRSQDLTNIFKPSLNLEAKLTVVSDQGQSTVTFKLSNDQSPLGPIKIGQDLDLTTKPLIPAIELIYDLDGNSVINAADYSILINNFGDNPKNLAADINHDKKVDQEDLKLMLDKMTELGLPVPSITPKPR